MRLILANTADTQLSEKRMTFGVDNRIKRGYNFRMRVNRHLAGCNDDDNAKAIENNLVTGITGGVFSTLGVILFPSSENRNYELVVYSCRNKKNMNLLKILRERFQDKVMISLEIVSTRPRPEPRNRIDFKLRVPPAAWVVLHEDDDRFVCQVSSVFIQNLDLTALTRSFSFQVKVIAHIDDDVFNPDSNLARTTNKKILEEGFASDVIIEAGNGVEIKSHKCFLISASSVFQRMFASGMEESKSGRVDMTDISEKGIRTFLQYIYYGERIGQKESLELAYELLYASHKYDIPKLEASMKTHLLNRDHGDFSVALAFKIYSFVKGVEAASELKDKMIRIMSLKYKELNELPEFKEVFQKNPTDALEICGNLINARPPPSMKRGKLDFEENNFVKKRTVGALEG